MTGKGIAYTDRENVERTLHSIGWADPTREQSQMLANRINNLIHRAVHEAVLKERSSFLTIETKVGENA